MVAYLLKRGVQTDWSYVDTVRDARWQFLFFLGGLVVWVPIAWVFSRRPHHAGPPVTGLLTGYLLTSFLMSGTIVLNVVVYAASGGPALDEFTTHGVDLLLKLFQLVAFFVLTVLLTAGATAPSMAPTGRGGVV